MISRQLIVRDFFDEAEAIRDALDTHFRNPYTDTIGWHYFCDPRHYTYLRTSPVGVIPAALLSRFLLRMRFWCVSNLGLVPMNLPSLHLMVNGCRLGLHSDFHNGAWGYVYSLTRWERRTFSGGETLLLRDGVPSYKKHHVHGETIYELIPAHFNQLLIFDDRIVHGTPTIEGSMNALEGRIALVGHIRATSPLVTGDLPWTEARKVILEALRKVSDRIRNHKDVQGTITYRLSVSVTGTVESLVVLTDNVVTPVTGYERSEAVYAVKSVLQQAMTALKFPPTPGDSTVIVPVLVPLPDLRPIEFQVPHISPCEILRERAKGLLADGSTLELKGDWDGDMFNVREPIAGTIRIEHDHIAVSFDPPMWVPSQRESFQTALTEWMKTAWIGATP